MVLRNPDGDESAGDGCVAATHYLKLLPYNEYHSILVFRVFSAVPDLVSLTRGSFPNPVHALGCPIDSVLTHG